MVLSFVHGLLENLQPAPAQFSTPKTEGGSEKGLKEKWREGLGLAATWLSGKDG